jgi:catechol 2,3-dioxygenase-like lactoylglutathione lyase family enzyme
MAEPPVFDQVNLIVRDMVQTLDFYRRLGLAVPDAATEWPPGTGALHAEAVAPSGLRLEFDNVAMARIWHPGWQEPAVSRSQAVLSFSLDSREAVDELYATLTAAGAPGAEPPYDAFWGARYAIVQDPEGNSVGLMSPIDPTRKFVPQAP